MFNRKQKATLFLLLLAGFVVALKLLHIDYMVNYSAEAYKSFCNVNETFNCDAVAASPFSHIFGIPIALIGTWANLFLMVFLFIGQKYYKKALRTIFTAIFAIYALGCVVLAVVSFIFVPALCFVCMIYWAISIVTFIYLLLISKKERFPITFRIFEMLDVIWGKKILTIVLIIIFLSPVIYAHFHFSKCGCESVGSGAMCCENFDKETNEAYLGRQTGKVRITIYTDFECPWCKKANYYVTEIMKRYEKQIKFVRKDFPLDMACNPIVTRPFHNNACIASYYAKCAGQQGKYWQYHDAVYENQNRINEDNLILVAKQLSLNARKLRDCAEGESIHGSVRNEIDEAIHYNISGTPAFRIYCEVLGTKLTDDIINEYITNYPSIKSQTLKRIYDTKMSRYLQIVDIRDEGDFLQGHLDGAVNIPLDSLKSSITELKKAVPVLIYDSYGFKNDEAFDLLKNAGFEDVRTLLGGYTAWLKYVDNGADYPNAESKDVITSIDVGAAYELIENNKALTLLDLRTKEEYENSHIRGAINIPVDELAANYTLLNEDKSKSILIYCNTQNKSWAGAHFLETKGFNGLVIIEGGIQDWLKAGYPVVQGEAR